MSDTYLKSIQEFSPVDEAIAIKMSLEFLSIFFANLDTVVHQSPPEVIDIKSLVTLLVHGLEDGAQFLGTEARSIIHSLLEIPHGFVDIELGKLFYGTSI